MISESHTRYGSRVPRQGRSRWNWRNQASSCLRNAASACPVSMARRDSRTSGQGFVEVSFHLTLLLFEEDDEGRTPDRVGKEAARLAGDDDFEQFRRCCEFGDELLIGVERERLYDGKMPKNVENVFFRWRQWRIEVHAAELQHRIGLIKMPGDIRAKGHGALEAIVEQC